MQALLVQILIAIVQTVLIVLGVKYLPSYLSQKGKNLATKEDIAEITQKIEEVKTAYKDRYDLSKTERDLYNIMIESIHDFLVEIKKYEFRNNVSLTNEVVMSNDELREKLFKFKDTASLFVSKSYVFLKEENYMGLKEALDTTSSFADLANNLLDAMRRSLYPDTQLSPRDDPKEFKYN